MKRFILFYSECNEAGKIEHSYLGFFETMKDVVDEALTFIDKETMIFDAFYFEIFDTLSEAWIQNKLTQLPLYETTNKTLAIEFIRSNKDIEPADYLGLPTIIE